MLNVEPTSKMIYRMEENLGGKKRWQIWQMTINLPNFPCPNFYNFKATTGDQNLLNKCTY